MIDRNARDKMVEAIEAYMDEKIEAFEFDDQIMDISWDCKDIAVQRSVEILWYFYDDLVDHKVTATKESWNLFHRILLLLKSDADISVSRQVIWSVTQIIALICLLVIPVAAVCSGSTWPYPVCWFCAGVLSYAMSRYRGKIDTDFAKEYKEHYDSYPFQTWWEIFQAAKSVSGFHKKKLPQEILVRKIRAREGFLTKVTNMLLLVFCWIPLIAIGWIVVSPIILVAQIFPVRNVHYKIEFHSQPQM